MLKERGAEKTGYRGCLVGLLVGGVVGGGVGYRVGALYVEQSAPAMPGVVMSVMFASVGFVVGALLGILVVWLIDLFTRKREQEADEF